MRVLIEGYQYKATDVAGLLQGLDTLENNNQQIIVNNVGYLYNPHIHDCVFILPKVLIDKDNLVFSKYTPKSIIHLESCNELEEDKRSFIYEFSVWIYRALSVFNQQNPDNTIVNRKQMTQVGSHYRHLTNTYLEVLMALVDFNRRNKQFFMTILKNMHLGLNKINWNKTISHSEAIIQQNAVVYLNPINKKRQINFDEELIIIYFSILNHISEKYGFPVTIDMGFELLNGAKFEHYIAGYGLTRLRQIKYKYYSDKALYLWELCYAFFEKAHNISVSSDMQEYLVAKDFNIIFEAIIDELIGDKDVPDVLINQKDGKRVDHIYRDLALTNVTGNDGKSIYYIGDSKYYQYKNPIPEESVYKQYTYAKNVIQWNMDIFNDEKPKDEQWRRKIAKYRDDVTEGYNIVPNFFISARINESLSYDADAIYTTNKDRKSFISKQFKNRLFDRDTLLIYHYDVNFLYIVSLYAQNNDAGKEVWKAKVRQLFRKKILKMLADNFDFYVMEAHPNVDGIAYIKEHFQSVLGKIYSPYPDQSQYSLALDSSPEYREENQLLLNELKQYFYVEPCAVGANPESILAKAKAEQPVVIAPSRKDGVLMVMMEGYDNKSQSFLSEGKIAIALKQTAEAAEIKANINSISYVLFHTRKDDGMHLFAVENHPFVTTKDATNGIYRNMNTAEEYMMISFRNDFELMSSSLHPSKAPWTRETRYDAQYISIDKLKS